MFGLKKVFRAFDKPLVHPGPDDDGVRRITSKAMFEGESGEFFKRIELTADAPSNLVLTQELLDARIDVRKQEQKRFLQAINAKLPPGCEIIPHAMLPWSLWQGRHAEYMFKEDMYPMDAWNNMLLPANPHTATVLGLPEHPRGVLPALEKAAEAYLDEIIGKVSDAHRKILESMKNFEKNISFGDFADLVDKSKHEIRVCANYLAIKQFGKPAWERHRSLFGSVLGMDAKPAWEDAG